MSRAPTNPSAPPSPRWVVITDGFIELLIWLVLAGGFFSYGYVSEPLHRGLAYAACGLLGCWGAAGMALGRWDGPSMAAPRWILAAFVAALLFSGFQIVPLPQSWTLAISPAWRETAAAFAACGLDLPRRIAFAHNPAAALASWNQLAASALFFMGVATLATRRHCALRLALAVALVCSIEGVLGFFSVVLSARAQGAVFNSNHHAALVLMGMPLYFVRLMQWRRSRPDLADSPLLDGGSPLPVFLLLGLVALVGWVAAISRGSVLAAPIVLGPWLFIEWRARRRELAALGVEPAPGSRALRLLTLAALVGGLALLVFSSETLAGFQRRGLGGELDGHGRIALWRGELEALSAEPWFGLGLRGTEAALTRHARWPLTTNPIWAHNDYVQTLGELGIPATLVLLILFALACISIARNLRSSAAGPNASRDLLRRAAAAGALTALVHAFADFHLRIPLVGFVFLILIALAATPGGLLISNRSYARLFGVRATLRHIRHLFCSPAIVKDPGDQTF